jgi:hypothetical protein
MSLTKATFSMIADAPLNVKDFGAVGDGATDDTAAIQAALDVGGKIYFPAGDYRFYKVFVSQASTYLYGESNTVSLLRPFAGQTGDSSATVPNRAGFITKLTENLAIEELTIKDIGFVGYRDGSAPIPSGGNLDFVRIVTAVGTTDKNIMVDGCRFIDPVRDGVCVSVRANVANTSYGLARNITMQNCIGDVTDLTVHATPNSNMFRTMIESITYNQVGTYGYYPISACYSLNNYCYGWRTLTDFKRGTKEFVCANNVTLNITDVHHSCDGATIGTFTGNVGRCNNDATDTGRFIEIQGVDISVNGAVFDANGLASGGGIMVQDYPYPAEGAIGSVGHQSINIQIDDFICKNVLNQHAVRIINAANASVTNVKAIGCTLDAVSFAQVATTDLENPPNLIQPIGGYASACQSIDGRAAFSATSTFPVAFTNCVDQANNPSIAWAGAYADVRNIGIKTLDVPIVMNDNQELRIFTGDTDPYGWTVPASITATTSTDVPYDCVTALSLNDTSGASVAELQCNSKFEYADGAIYYVRHWTKLGTAPTAGMIVRFYTAADAFIANQFIAPIGLTTDWKELVTQIVLNSHATAAYFKIGILPATNSNAPLNTGTSIWANFRLSKQIPLND